MTSGNGCKSNFSAQKVVCASGYFDPIHAGHIEYLEKSRMIGDKLVVIVNNDKQAEMKKGKAFMPCTERLKVVRALRCVDFAFEAVDDDRSVCKSLRHLKPDIFTNGGDQTNTGVPEGAVCDELGIEMVDDLGAKIQSSSWLIKEANDFKKSASNSTSSKDATKE